MARRNPMNPRYAKHTAPSGTTRKSAAAAKPKRSAGESPVSKKGSSSSKPARSTMLHPPTPEYKKLRRVWWGLLVGAMAFSTLSWWLWQDETWRAYGNYVLVAAYACLAFAIWLDFARLRPLRLKYNATGGKPDKAEKPVKEAAPAADTGSSAADDKTDAAEAADTSEPTEKGSE